MRILFLSFGRLFLVSSMCGMSWTAGARGVENAGALPGRVQLPSGRQVDYTLHYDRYALEQSIRLRDCVVALTSAGTLLRFDLPSFRLIREKACPEKVTCFGLGEGGKVLAGLSDGRICHFDPFTFELTEKVKLPYEPRWIGWSRGQGAREAGLVVATRPARSVAFKDGKLDVPYSVIHDLSTGKTYAFEKEARAFLLDHLGRLWVGEDHGEWGGQVTRIDLTDGTLMEIPPPRLRRPGFKPFWEGVYGFVELLDGQIWAFGGTSHMMNHGEITRIDTGKPET